GRRPSSESSDGKLNRRSSVRRHENADGFANRFLKGTIGKSASDLGPPQPLVRLVNFTFEVRFRGKTGRICSGFETLRVCYPPRTSPLLIVTNHRPVC